jgi:hypothetical protein
MGLLIGVGPMPRLAFECCAACAALTQSLTACWVAPVQPYGPVVLGRRWRSVVRAFAGGTGAQAGRIGVAGGVVLRVGVGVEVLRIEWIDDRVGAGERTCHRLVFAGAEVRQAGAGIGGAADETLLSQRKTRGWRPSRSNA